MTVSELSERMSLEELRDWAAYEKVTGALDNTRLEERLVALEIELRLSNWMFAQAKFTDDDTRNFLDPKGDGPAFRPGDMDIPLPTDGWEHTPVTVFLEPTPKKESDDLTPESESDLRMVRPCVA